MPSKLYNSNFLETPDPVSGLQRRTGQNFLDHKQTLHERLTLEHDFNPGEGGTQPNHGTHTKGSAKAYINVFEDGTYDPSGFPVNRPTGQDKNGNDLPDVVLDDDDAGRIFFKDGQVMYVWQETEGWVQFDTNPIGFIQIWPGVVAPPPIYLLCNGQSLAIDEYQELYDIIGWTYTDGEPAASFSIPNLQGISVVGAGQQTDFGPDDRTKGSNAAIGDQVEDQNQSFDGTARATESYNDNNIFNEVDGIFSIVDRAGSEYKTLDRTSRFRQSSGFGINLDNELISGEFYRHGTETRVSALAMAYYIKAK